MKLDRQSIDVNMSQAEIDALVNSLVLSFAEFAAIAGLKGRAYGVRTACDTKSDLVNSCGRQQIYRHLIESHVEAERIVHYDLTPRYHVEKVEYSSLERIQLKRPGFDGFYQQSITDAVMGAQAVNPFLIQNVPLIDSGDGYIIAQLDASLVDNPLKIVLIDSNSGHQYNLQSIYGFPRLQTGNWEVPLLLSSDVLGSVTIHAYHCEFIRVDIPDEVLTAGQTLYPVYPGTNQIIPYAKDPESLSPSGTRLWFYAHSLVNEDFGADGVDLRGGYVEFYKLLSSIDMKIFEDTEVLPALTYRLDAECVTGTTETSNETPSFTDITIESYKTISAKDSIVELFPDHSTAKQSGVGYPLEYTIYYKTDPENIESERDVLAIKEAVAHKTAAEIPLKMCGCSMDKDGFIELCQQAYDQVRISYTGEMVRNLQHGKLYGQEVFREKIHSVFSYIEVIRL